MKVKGYLRVQNGIFQTVIRYKDTQGKWRDKSESTGLPEKGNKRRAQTILDKRLKEWEAKSQTAVETGEVLFLDFMRSWLNEVIRYKVRPNTFREYERIFDHSISVHAAFAGIKLQELTPAMVQGYYNTVLAAGVSPNTVRKYHANIHKCLAYALRLDLIAKNPTEKTELPPKGKYQGATALTKEEVGQLLRAFTGDALETVVRLAANYGLRRSEVCGLRWKDIDFEANTIHVCHTAAVVSGKVVYNEMTKNVSSNRELPLTPSIRDYLLKVKTIQEEQRKLLGNGYTDSDLVCVHPDGVPIHPDTVTHHFQRVLKKKHLTVIRFHDLRHCAVYLLRKGGIDVKDIQVWLGHSNITTTLNTYGHVLSEDLKRAGDVMDLMLYGDKEAS